MIVLSVGKPTAVGDDPNSNNDQHCRRERYEFAWNVIPGKSIEDRERPRGSAKLRLQVIPEMCRNWRIGQSSRQAR
jgi:hypothetical protein